ncbi:hypothetical protein B0J14DRAFT_568353 [Halenospora varia]|nr:hypothetical protein B0J14DRAFT_568353 [Halenospora varia]
MAPTPFTPTNSSFAVTRMLPRAKAWAAHYKLALGISISVAGLMVIALCVLIYFCVKGNRESTKWADAKARVSSENAVRLQEVVDEIKEERERNAREPEAEEEGEQELDGMKMTPAQRARANAQMIERYDAFCQQRAGSSQP